MVWRKQSDAVRPRCIASFVFLTISKLLNLVGTFPMQRALRIDMPFYMQATGCKMADTGYRMPNSPQLVQRGGVEGIKKLQFGTS